MGELQLVTLLSFAGITSAVAAVGWAARDMFSRGENREKSSLRRLPLVRDEVPPTGLSKRIDYYLNRLVLESGLGWSSMVATLLQVASGLSVGGLLFLWNDNLLLGAIGGILGMAIPLQFLIYRRTKRLQTMQMQLPDVLDLLSRAVRAGESLDQAIDLAGRKSAQPLAKEFARCARQLQMGLSVPAAMRALSRRVRLMEMRIFATTLSVFRQGGGNLAQTLERMAAVVRDRLNYRRQLRSTTAAGRFSAMMIGAAGPLLFAYMFIFQNEYASKLLALPLGQLLLTVAVVLEIIGLLWIVRMMKTDY